MDCQRDVENNGFWHTVPDEIMNSSTPLHCLERDIAKRMHAKVQREIGEHDETSCEAKPSDRHLVAENARIYHLTPPPVGTQHRTTRHLWSGRANVNPSMSASGHKRRFDLPVTSWIRSPVVGFH